MTLSIRFRWNAVAAGVLLLLLSAGGIAATSHTRSLIIALLSIAFTLGVTLLVAVERHAAELIRELRAAASALVAASVRVSDSPELSAYLASRAERLQRTLERFDGVRPGNNVRAAAVKPVIPFVPQRFPSGGAISDK